MYCVFKSLPLGNGLHFITIFKGHGCRDVAQVYKTCCIFEPLFYLSVSGGSEMRTLSESVAVI